MSKSKPKKPVWENNEQQIDKYIQEQLDAIKANEKIAENWSKRANESNDPNQKAFFALCSIQQRHYVNTLHMYLSMLQWSKDLNRELSQKLQYLDDNTQTIATKLKVEISTVQKEVANVQLVNADVHKFLQKTEQDNDKLKKMGESNIDYATRSR